MGICKNNPKNSNIIYNYKLKESIKKIFLAVLFILQSHDLKQVNIDNNNILHINEEIRQNKDINILEEKIKQNSYFHLEEKIDQYYNLNGKINLNKIISEIKKDESYPIKGKFNNIVNIGLGLDSSYILETMLTMASIMDSQRNTTKIIFHLAIIYNFTSKDMLKIYTLKERINNSTEFNFYLCKETTDITANFYKKMGGTARLELYKYLPHDVERLLIFDAGDILIFRDLSEMYNINMENKWIFGTLEPYGSLLFNKKYKKRKYINMGAFLINCTKFKEIKFWELFIKNLNTYKIEGTSKDQSLLNLLIPDENIGYFPFKFGGFSPFVDDISSDSQNFLNYHYKKMLKNKNDFINPPKDYEHLVLQLFNPVYIHQIDNKWYKGSGLSIYRNYARNCIRLANIWDELCKKKPGYCLRSP